MGTNFYLRRDPCPTCGRSDEQEHVGKQSAGWRFQFHGGNGLPESWQAWRGRIKEGLLVDEYGERVSLEEFERLVEARKDRKAPDDAEFDAEGHPFYRGEFS